MVKLSGSGLSGQPAAPNAVKKSAADPFNFDFGAPVAKQPAVAPTNTAYGFGYPSSVSDPFATGSQPRHAVPPMAAPVGYGYSAASRPQQPPVPYGYPQQQAFNHIQQQRPFGY